VLPQYWFGFYSAFSGQTLYEAVIYQMYNIFFTSIPIMWFAIFDFEHHKEVFLLNPRLYKLGLSHSCFSTKVFWQWFALGAFQALVNLLVCFYAMGEGMIGNRLAESLWLSGSLVYASVVIVANFKIYLAYNNVNVIGILLVVASILMYFAFLAFEDKVMGVNEIIGLSGYLLGQGLSYIGMFFMVVFVYV
jgi:phospholipid-transporting ATPase